PSELDSACRLVEKLHRYVRPDALIIQDLGFLPLVTQVGYKGELHLSTLAAVTHPSALPLIRERLRVDRVILPREMSLEEVRLCAAACPPGLSLEVFVHGALCYGISGRCYWSSFLGGRSGLRGRCVQPCRRLYSGKNGRLPWFSCRDLSLNVSVEELLGIPQVTCWKIEGRKKGPHYVYHTTKAYRLLRDERTDPKAQREALALLEHALGRPTTRSTFLTGRPENPVAPRIPTASGKLVGRAVGDIKGVRVVSHKSTLLAGDLLRIGFEDDSWHQTVALKRSVPRGGSIHVKGNGSALPKQGAHVYLIDRRDPKLSARIRALRVRMRQKQVPVVSPSLVRARKPRPAAHARRNEDMHVWRHPPRGRSQRVTGVWLRPGVLQKVPRASTSRVWWWLPPVVWADEESAWHNLAKDAIKMGARNFVLNAPWQAGLGVFADTNCTVWAGPFCNATNPLAIEKLRSLGFQGVVISPELGKNDFLSLPKLSPLPLGVVVEGLWPLCISRTLAADERADHPYTSPKGETCWARRYGQNYWIFPGWPLDIRAERPALAAAGYAFFIFLHEPWAKHVPRPNRTSFFNWKTRLL
ncbi:U32 family peptidase, partial [Thermodesulfobacteriota bacterium]